MGEKIISADRESVAISIICSLLVQVEKFIDHFLPLGVDYTECL